MFTLIHVVVSLVGIVAGLVVAGGFVAGKRLDRWALVFLVTTIATSVTGFGFPFVTLLPSHIVGVVSLVVLSVVIVAQYVKHFAGALIVAPPTQSEPPFALTQGLVLALFVWLGVAADKGFRAAPAGMA